MTLLDYLLKALVIVVCFLLAVPVGTPAVRALLRRVARQPQPLPPGTLPAEPSASSGQHHATVDLAPSEGDAVPGIVGAGEELSGGYWIGLLERAALFASVLSGFPAGIAVVLAVKSIGRYPELRTPTGSKGELFIIGTFASMLWAAAFAGLAYGLVRLW